MIQIKSFKNYLVFIRPFLKPISAQEQFDKHWYSFYLKLVLKRYFRSHNVGMDYSCEVYSRFTNSTRNFTFYKPIWLHILSFVIWLCNNYVINHSFPSIVYLSVYFLSNFSFSLITEFLHWLYLNEHNKNEPYIMS